MHELVAVRHTVAVLESDLTALRGGVPAVLIPPRQLLALPRDKAESVTRTHVRPMLLGDHRALSIILARYKFFSDTRDVGFGTHILTDGFWEMWLTQFMAKTIKEGMFVLDVGANFGYYSVLMADLIGPNGRLIAFEPNPVAAASAEATLFVNGFSSRSTVLRSAASDSTGQTSFSIPHSEPKNARMVPAGYTSPDAHTIEVPTVTIDEICRSERKVDFIKIDAEGGEYNIVKGMQTILERDRPKMILEFNASRDNANPLLQMLLQAYGSLRYLGFDGDVHGVTPECLISENFGEDWLLFLE
jgi:FkbM family methyltransferase